MAVRWLKSHGSLTNRTILAEDTALAHAEIFPDIVESLWSSHKSVTSATSARPAVASAIDILASGALNSSQRQQNYPSASKSDDVKIDKKTLLTSEVSEVTQQMLSPSSQPKYTSAKPTSMSFGSASPTLIERLAVATRGCIRESLLHLGSLQVLKWRCGQNSACVKVGVQRFWSADILLTSLDPEIAVFEVYAINIMIKPHIDAASQTNFNSIGKISIENRVCQLTSSQEAILCSAVNKRMKSALQAARNMESGQSAINSTCVMMCALRDMMIDDVCAPLAMDHIRAQALALSEGRWKGYLTVEGASSDTPRSVPLTIEYWLQHRQQASIRITEFQSVDSTKEYKKSTTTKTESYSYSNIEESQTNSLSDPMDIERERKPLCVVCTHEPSLPSAVELHGEITCPVLEMDNLDIEQLLLSAIRTRIQARLEQLTQVFKRMQNQLKIDPSCVTISPLYSTVPSADKDRRNSAENVLLIDLGGSGHNGIEVRVFPLSGGTRIRPYGAASLSQRVQRGNGAVCWTGVKQFDSLSSEVDAVISAFHAVRIRVKLNASARSVCALDIGVSNTLPPGTASVAATASADRAASQLVPPFAPLERRAPRRFLTLSPPPPAKDALANLQGSSSSVGQTRLRSSGSRWAERNGPTKRPRLTYATTSDALVFIQESSFPGEDWQISPRPQDEDYDEQTKKDLKIIEADSIDRYSGTAAAAAAWALTREVVERRLRRDSLIRAFVTASVASTAHMPHLKSSDDSDLHLESASRVLLKVKCEPLPVRRAELLLRGYDAWQVRLSLLPPIFDSTDSLIGSDDNDGESTPRSNINLWSVGVSCTGSQLTFTYPSAVSASVRSFFRDLTRARTAAALARGVPPSRFYRVIRRSPVRIIVGIGPYLLESEETETPPKPLYTTTVEYVYSKGNSGGFSLSFNPPTQTMEQLAPMIAEALDASGGQVGGILAGLLERACPVAAAAETARRENGPIRIRFVTALRVRVTFRAKRPAIRDDRPDVAGGAARNQNPSYTDQPLYGVDVDARGGSGLVTVIDVGRATAVMVQLGVAQRLGTPGGAGSQRRPQRNDFVALPRWDEFVAELTREGHAEAQRAGSTVVLRMEALEKFLTNLVKATGPSDNPSH